MRCDLEKTHSDDGKANGNYYIIYWGYRGIMEKKMETTIMGYRVV